MTQRKVPMAFAISSEQHEELKALSARTRVPMAELIRQAVAGMLRNDRQSSARHEQLERLRSQLQSEVGALLAEGKVVLG